MCAFLIFSLLIAAGFAHFYRKEVANYLYNRYGTKPPVDKPTKADDTSAISPNPQAKTRRKK